MRWLLLVTMMMFPLRTMANEADDEFYMSTAAFGALGGGVGFMFSSCFTNKDDAGKWTMSDTTLELTFVGLTMIDMMQTLSFRKKGGHELNPILGRSPTLNEVRFEMLGGIAAHAVIAYLLPHPWRSIWQGIGIGVEFDAVMHNHQLGVKLTTPW